MTSIPSLPLLGSSPHTRGALLKGWPCSRPPRIIPAYAGSTGIPLRDALAPRDHPRIRGEHERFNDYKKIGTGSSPHTRGALYKLREARNSGRIIPAYAGSTWSSSSRMVVVRDHPRIRGEHPWSEPLPGVDDGSSPHTRGARRRPGRPRRSAGIIPAYAGSTVSPQVRGAIMWDHPRIRGEHESSTSRSRPSPGSSPHTRGAPLRSEVSELSTGIIPAYAGSTTGSGPAPTAFPDHPRIRGEHSRSQPDNAGGRGSSPHTRGARPDVVQARTRPGIIPAYAGSTTRTSSLIAARPDHPRIRGEHNIFDTTQIYP